MTSKQTQNRIAKIKALKRIFINVYNILHTPYIEIDKIPMNFLLNTELQTKKYAPDEKSSDRYISESYISGNDNDRAGKTSRKNTKTIKSRFDEVFK